MINFNMHKIFNSTFFGLILIIFSFTFFSTVLNSIIFDNYVYADDSDGGSDPGNDSSAPGGIGATGDCPNAGCTSCSDGNQGNGPDIPDGSGSCTPASSCTWGREGNCDSSTVICIDTPPTPTLSFSASPTTVDPTSPTTLTWSITDATTCDASASPADANWNGAKTASNGTHTQAITPRVTTTYSLSCTGSGGTAGPVSTTVIVNPPIVNFTASPTLIGPGSASTLTWSTIGADTCTGSGGTTWAGNKNVPNGSRSVTPTITTIYSLSCTGPSGTTNRDATVTLPSGEISATSCEIPAGGASCNTTVTWSSANFLGSRSVLQQGIEFSTAVTDSVSRSVTPITKIFTLRDTGSTFMREFEASVNCHVSSVWVTPLSICLLLPVIDIKASPNIIRSGQQANVRIDILANYNLNCSVTGGINQTFNHRASGSPEPYTFTTNPLTAAQIVTVSCVSPLYDVVTGTDRVKVNVIPTIQEI